MYTLLMFDRDILDFMCIKYIAGTGRTQDAVFVFISFTPSIFLAYLPLPHPPKLTGTNAFQLLEHTAKVVQLSDSAFQTDFFYTFVGKPQHPFRMGDPHLLQVSDQSHAILLFEQSGQIVLVDEEVTVHRFQRHSFHHFNLSRISSALIPSASSFFTTSSTLAFIACSAAFFLLLLLLFPLQYTLPLVSVPAH